MPIKQSLKQYMKGNGFEARHLITLDRADLYAHASGDYNPVHLNERFAHKIGLSGPILHGLCTMAILCQKGCNFIGDSAWLRRIKVKFTHPVFLGDTLTIRGEVTAVEPNVVLALDCRNQGGIEVLSQNIMEFSQEEKPIPMPCLQGHREEVVLERVLAYADGVGIPLDRQAPRVPPLYGALLATQPLLQCVFPGADLPRSVEEARSDRFSALEAPKVLHLSQEFHFARSLRIHENLTTDGEIEKTSTKKGQKFIYFVSRSWDDQKEGIVLGRALLAVG